MLRFKKSLMVSVLLIINQLCGAFEFQAINFFSSERLKNIQLFHNEIGFYVIKDKKVINIPRYYLDPELKDISADQLNALLNNGYIYLKQIADEEFFLRAHINGYGGNKWVISAISFAMGFFCNTELEKLLNWHKEDRREAADERKRKAEWQKTLKDRVSEMYDKVLYDGVLVSLMKQAKNNASDSEIYNLSRLLDAYTEHHQQIKDHVVLQITEKVLKLEAASEDPEVPAVPVVPAAVTAAQADKAKWDAEFTKASIASQIAHAEYNRQWAHGPFNNPRLNEIHYNNEIDSCVIS